MVSKFLLSDPLREGLRYFKDVAALLRLVRFPWQKRLEFTHICWSKKELQNQLSRNLWKSSLGRKLYVVKNLGAISAFADTFNYPYQLLMVDVVWLDWLLFRLPLPCIELRLFAWPSTWKAPDSRFVPSRRHHVGTCKSDIQFPSWNVCTLPLCKRTPLCDYQTYWVNFVHTSSPVTAITLPKFAVSIDSTSHIRNQGNKNLKLSH